MHEAPGYMQVYCPICRTEFDGMRAYGRDWPCCCKECHAEAEWRRSLAILNKPYYPKQPLAKHQTAVPIDRCAELGKAKGEVQA